MAVLRKIEKRSVIETVHRARENCSQVFLLRGRQQGTSQGRPLSPLRANVRLDDVGMALEARGCPASHGLKL